MIKYILFDTETTGTSEEDRIIQVGAMIVAGKAKIEVYDELCSCDTPIKLEAMEVHGLVPEVFEGKPRFVETDFYKTLTSLNTHDNYLIAHNMPFDLGMLEKEGFTSNMKIIDTLRCAKHLLPKENSHRLQYLRYSLGLYKSEKSEATKYNITAKAHDAIGDVLVMKLLLSHLVGLTKKAYVDANPMEKLEELTRTPILIETFKFGKYKGRVISEVFDEDMRYINWMLDNMDLDSDMQYTLDKIMGHI